MSEGNRTTLWVTSDPAWAISGSFAWLSVVLTTHQIIQHLKYYTQPNQQKWIVRILFMVPIYSLSSWLSLRYYHLSIYFDTIRNIYEGACLRQTECDEAAGGGLEAVFGTAAACCNAASPVCACGRGRIRAYVSEPIHACMSLIVTAAMAAVRGCRLLLALGSGSRYWDRGYVIVTAGPSP